MPTVEKAAQLRSGLAPATCAPSRAIFDPAGERDLAIGRGGVDAHIIVAGGGRGFSHDVTRAEVLVEDGDIAEAPPRLRGERGGNDLCNCVRGLSFETAIAGHEGDHCLSRLVACLVAARFTERHFRGADDPRCRTIVELKLDALDVPSLGEVSEQSAIGAGEAVYRLVWVADREQPHITLECKPANDPVESDAEVLVFVYGEHGKFGLYQRQDPVMLGDQSLSEDDQVVKVDQTGVAQLRFVGLRPRREFRLGLPIIGGSVEHRATVTSEIK